MSEKPNDTVAFCYERMRKCNLVQMVCLLSIIWTSVVLEMVLPGLSNLITNLFILVPVVAILIYYAQRMEKRKDEIYKILDSSE